MVEKPLGQRRPELIDELYQTRLDVEQRGRRSLATARFSAVR